MFRISQMVSISQRYLHVFKNVVIDTPQEWKISGFIGTAESAQFLVMKSKRFPDEGNIAKYKN